MPSTLRSFLALVVILGLFLGYLPWQSARLIGGAQALPGVFSSVSLLLFFAGAVLFFAGAYYLSWRGEGAPFSIDPPKRMVVAGPYARLQHPMTVGLLLMVSAEALWCGSVGVGLYAIALTLVAKLYLSLVEEPRLERRFGDDYRAYRDAVPRWLPFRRRSQ